MKLFKNSTETNKITLNSKRKTNVKQEKESTTKKFNSDLR